MAISNSMKTWAHLRSSYPPHLIGDDPADLGYGRGEVEVLADSEDENDDGHRNPEAPIRPIHSRPGFQNIGETQAGAEIIGEYCEPTRERGVADLRLPIADGKHEDARISLRKARRRRLRARLRCGFA